ncbi:hypothetical protein [Bradyrhizobium sp. CCGE-LA001]|uniref:hypothetical protein n=1 Tax=Bradyrhizobium sp. CCGE-LA001 TaxID=1223566 RepID=UPI001198238B|nr:hypothetical protein [Bradyrhizobium sp. CCGE-LA001]
MVLTILLTGSSAGQNQPNTEAETKRENDAEPKYAVCGHFFFSQVTHAARPHAAGFIGIVPATQLSGLVGHHARGIWSKARRAESQLLCEKPKAENAAAK